MSEFAQKLTVLSSIKIQKSIALSRILLFLLGFIYVLLLHFSYVRLISPKWAYIGYVYNNPPLIAIFLAWVTALCPLIWMPINFTRPSQIVYWFLYLVVVVPVSLISVYVFIGKMDPLITINWPVLLSFALISVIYKLPLVRFPRIRVPSTVFWLVIGCLLLFTYSNILYHFGFKISLPHLFSSEVYEKRLEARETIVEAGKFLGYILSWTGQVIGPFLIAFGLYFRNWMLIAMGVLGQLLCYSAEAVKSAILSPLMLLGLFVLFRRDGAKYGLKIIVAAVSLEVICPLIDTIFAPSDLPLTSLMIRRLIVTPGLLTGYYFEFFSDNPKAYLGHSIFRNFVNYPYDLTPPFIIGLHYFNNPATSANANIWADAFANFGYLGIFLFGLILALVLWLFDCFSRSLPIQLSILMLAVPSFAFLNSALLTSILTHGILGVLILVWLLPRELGMRSERQTAK